MRKSYIVAAIAITFISLHTASAQELEYTKGVWFDVSVGTGDYLSLPDSHTMYAGDFALGYRFNPHFALGVGAGLTVGIKSSAVNMPAFLKIRYDMLDRFATPFICVDLGYAFTPSRQTLKMAAGSPASPENATRYMVGPYDNLTLGVALRIEKGHRIWFGLSGGYYMTGCMQENGGEKVCSRNMDLFSGMIRIGYDF